MEQKIINFSWINIWNLGRKCVSRLWQIENFATRETEQIYIFCFWAKLWESNVFKISLIAFFSLLGVLGLIWYTACPIWNFQNARKMAKTGVLSFWAQICDLINGVKPYVISVIVRNEKDSWTSDQETLAPISSPNEPVWP